MFVSLGAFSLIAPYLPPPAPAQKLFLATEHIPTDSFLRAALIQVELVSYITCDVL